jgi:2,5-furandicarboxylate decarboxylase 1
VIPDLRSFLDLLRNEHPGDLWEIDQPVAPAHEMTALALELERRQQAPVLFFRQVTGYNTPVLSNLFASRRRLGLMLGLAERELVTGWSRVAARRLAPVPAAAAPVKDVVHTGSSVDLRRLPIPTHFEVDAGPYVTAGVVLARDPDTGAGNLSFARLQLKGPSTFGVSMHSRGDLWDYQRRAAEKGRPLEVAVAIGLHPAITLAAAARLPRGDDELALAGGLLGQPVPVAPAETVDLSVPAHAEIMLEGVLVADEHEDEGPFGEFTGYASGRSTRNILKVTAITHRHDAIYQDVVPGASAEHLNLSKTPRAGSTFSLVKARFPGVADLNYPSSGVHYHCYVSMRKTMEGSPKQLMMLLFGLEMFLKLVVVVDDDIDVYDEQAVLWALATRFQADRDVFVVPEVACNLLDPSSHNGLSAKMGLDATQRLGASEQRLSFSDGVLARVNAQIAAIAAARPLEA